MKQDDKFTIYQDKTRKQIVSDILDIADKFDNNDTLTITEVTTFLEGTLYDHLSKWTTQIGNWKRLDINKNGSLSRYELELLMLEYLTINNIKYKHTPPNTPSNKQNCTQSKDLYSQLSIDTTNLVIDNKHKYIVYPPNQSSFISTPREIHDNQNIELYKNSELTRIDSTGINKYSSLENICSPRKLHNIDNQDNNQDNQFILPNSIDDSLIEQYSCQPSNLEKQNNIHIEKNDIKVNTIVLNEQNDKSNTIKHYCWLIGVLFIFGLIGYGLWYMENLL